MRGPVSCDCVLDPSLGSPALVPSTTSDNSSRVVSDGGVLTTAVTAQLVVDTGMPHALGDRALSTFRDSAASPVDLGSDLVDLEGYVSFALITQMLLGPRRVCVVRGVVTAESAHTAVGTLVVGCMFPNTLVSFHRLQKSTGHP